MKVFLGAYREYSPCYHFIKGLFRDRITGEPRFPNFPEKFVDALEEVGFFFDRIYRIFQLPRIQYVKIDDHDAWGADYTLACIIKPLLEKLKKNKVGTPMSMFGDAYSKLTSSKEYWDEPADGPLHKKAQKLEEKAIKKWEQTLDDMIWSFGQLLKDEQDYDLSDEPKFADYKDVEEYRKACDEYHKRMSRGFRLFGEHYRSLWD